MVRLFPFLPIFNKTIAALALLLCSVSPALLAQTGPKFPEAPADFLKKLEEFMTASKRPDMIESFAVFEKTNKTGQISPQEMGRVIAFCNKMNDQKLAPFPYFKNYINAVSAAESNPDTLLFGRWHDQAEKTLAGMERGKSKTIDLYLNFSSDFLMGKALREGEGGSVTWKIKGGKFEFQFDNTQPVIYLENVQLIGQRKADSVVVKNTYGKYYPFDFSFKGEKGRVSWDRVGLDSSVYVQLADFDIDVQKPIYSSNKALFYYPQYFPGKALEGKFEDNVTAVSKDNVGYPKFEANEAHLTINNIGDGIQYEGGFRLVGTTIYGIGKDREKAKLTIFNNKRERIFFGTSDMYLIKPQESVFGEGVSANLFMDKDSLYHPSVNFKVELKDQTIQLYRGQKGSDRNPFFSSYYNMNLDAEKITWYLKYDSLDIGSRVGVLKGVEQSVNFQSNDRFDEAEYLMMQNISDVNPIPTLYLLAKSNGSDIVNDGEYAQKLNSKFDRSSIQSLLAEMVKRGFINYYFDRHEIELRPKLKLYALASQGKRDYDYIDIKSTSTTTNAQLSLKSRETTINEVDRMELSRKQKVGIVPTKQRITLMGNRDMRFGGKLFAGNALLSGEKMKFNYDKFTVDLDTLKYLDFYIPSPDEKDKKGNPILKPLNSRIEGITGVLLVDAPHNKSGKEDLPVFPSLQSKGNAHVYYDDSTILHAVYHRDSFYFRLDPFPFNGLDSYEAADLKFKGDMVSADIFPKFRETLVVQDEDKSLGFVHQTPPAGYPTYSEKGRYTGEVNLSNKGFRGKGKVEYLTADIDSEDLIFRPKQLTGTAKKFFMEEDRQSAVKVPQAKGEDVKVNWLPYRDSMYVESKAKAFELYKATGYSHKGLFILTPSGLKGRGEFEWPQGKLTSKLISYGPFQASADTADLQIKSLTGKEIAFDSRNVQGELDFDIQQGHFKANSDTASTTMPYDQYRTSMNEFTWDMKTQKITFKSEADKLGEFISIDPGQDSLRFRGKTALYDMNTNELKVGGVNYVQTCDAYIYPETGDVEIAPGGRMKDLKNARIVADTTNKYHVINRVNANIMGRKRYRADGYYEYNIPGYPQEVFFDNIAGDKSGEGPSAQRALLTTASGPIKETMNFHMDLKTLFKGNIILKANQRNLRFEGFAKLDADKLPVKEWFSIYTEVDKNDPAIKIKEAKNEDDEPLFTGLFLGKETGLLYPRILATPQARVDRPIINCEGIFKYNAQNDRFTFGDSAKVLNLSTRGPKMTFDNRTGDVQVEGPFNIGSGLNYMKITAAGKMKTNFSADTTSGYSINGEMMAGIEMIIPKALMDVMITDIKASTFDAQNIIFSTQMPFYEPALSDFLPDPKERADAVTYIKSNMMVMPKRESAKYTFLLGKHNIVWNQEYNSFLNADDKIPVVSIGGELINKMLTASIEYKMPADGDDRFYIYLKATPDLWYFYGYQAGVLSVTSSSTKFNDAVLGLKKKDLSQKMPDGETYEVQGVEPGTAERFLSRWKEGRKK